MAISFLRKQFQSSLSKNELPEKVCLAVARCNDMRAILDTMIFDKIVADEILRGKVLNLISASQLEILTTHIQEDQIAQIEDPAKREAIAMIPRTVIATGGGVWNVSKWDAFRWGSGAGPVKIEDVFRGNPKDIPDALIGATLSDADILVTEDKRFRKRAEALASERIWSFDMFCKYVHGACAA